MTQPKQPVNWHDVPKPMSYADLYAHYGNPDAPGFEEQFLVEYGLRLASGKVVKVTCHRAIQSRLATVNRAAGQYIVTYDGCYANRLVRGGTLKSLHAWGLAIDINAAQFPLGSDRRQVHALTVAFESQGFFYGGDYHHRKDPMHYQYAGDI